MMAQDVRIIAFQKTAAVQPTAIEGWETALQAMDADQLRQAEVALAQAFADGYELVTTAIGGNDRVLMTVYTLRPVGRVMNS